MWLRDFLPLFIGEEHGVAGQSAGNMAALVRSASDAAGWRAGRDGEVRTRFLLQPLIRLRGWIAFFDYRIPGSRTNLDATLISPSGHVVYIDSKKWTASCKLTYRHRQLHRDGLGVDLHPTSWEASFIAGALRIREVKAMAVIHGPRVPRGGVASITSRGPSVLCVGPTDMLRVLRAAPRYDDTARQMELVKRFKAAIPPYGVSDLPPHMV